MGKSPSTPARHNSQKFYIETHHVNGHIMVYLGTHSRNYYVRYNTVKGYITKSLRTTDLDKAIARSKELAELLLLQDVHGIRQRVTVAQITSWFMTTEEWANVSNGRQKQITRTLRIISDFFKNQPVDEIQRHHWKAYWKFRTEYYNNTDYEARAFSSSNLLAPKTLRGERITFHSVMGLAEQYGIIRKMPKMPPTPSKWIDQTRNPNRPDATFTKPQWNKFRRKLNDWVNSKNNNWRAGKQGVYTANLIRAVIWTIRHSGVRVKECLALRHSHLEQRSITTADGATHETFAMFVKPTKTLSPHSRYAILNHSGYKHLCEFIKLKEQMGMPAGDDDYVFNVWRSPSNAYPYNLLGAVFQRLAKSAGVYQIGDATNLSRATPRMLRRYYIIRQLDSGAPISHVAMAVGNKPSTIQRYYDSVMRERYEATVFSGSYYPNITNED